MFRTSKPAKRTAREEPAPFAGTVTPDPSPGVPRHARAGGHAGGGPALSSGRVSRREKRALRQWYCGTDVPLFGLPQDWTGYRCPGQRAGRQAIRRTGPFGILTRPGGPLWIAALGLTHIAGDGGRLHVATHRVTSYQTLEAMAAGNFFRRLAWPLLQQGDREAFDKAVIARRLRYRSGEFGWRRAVIPVDADAVHFRLLALGTEWVALAEIGDFCMQLDAQCFPIGRVRLVRITDPGPYVSFR